MHPSGRKISVGTFVMLLLTLLVIIGSTMVLIRLFSGNHSDLSTIGRNNRYIPESKSVSGDKTSPVSGSDALKNKRNTSAQYYIQTDENSNSSLNAGCFVDVLLMAQNEKPVLRKTYVGLDHISTALNRCSERTHGVFIVVVAVPSMGGNNHFFVTSHSHRNILHV